MFFYGFFLVRKDRFDLSDRGNEFRVNRIETNQERSIRSV